LSIDTKPVLEGKIQGNSDKQNNPQSSYSREHRNTGTAPPNPPCTGGLGGREHRGKTLYRLGSKIRLVS